MVKFRKESAPGSAPSPMLLYKAHNAPLGLFYGCTTAEPAQHAQHDDCEWSEEPFVMPALMMPDAYLLCPHSIRAASTIRVSET